MVRPNKTTAVRLKYQKSPDHLHDIGRARQVNSKVCLIELMHDALNALDRFFRVFAAFQEDDDIAGLLVFGEQQPAPKRAGQRVLKTFGTIGQTLDRAHLIDRFDLLRESLQPAQVSP